MHSIAEAADQNFVTHGTWIARHVASMHVDDDPELVLVDSGLACDTFNLVCRARLPAAHARARVRDAIAHFREGNRPFSWWHGPADRPVDLASILEGEGLAARESELLMTADLATMNAPFENLRIERVRTPEQLRDFADVSAASWNPPDPLVVRFYEMATSAVLTPDCPIAYYTGYLDDTAVASSELTVGGGVVGLYNVATRAEYRRRGFGTAMTLRPLLDARDAGHRTAILQASPEGVGVYARIGFTAAGRVTEYKP